MTSIQKHVALALDSTRLKAGPAASVEEEDRRRKRRGLYLPTRLHVDLYRHINLFSLLLFPLPFLSKFLHYLFEVVFFRALKIFLVLRNPYFTTTTQNACFGLLLAAFLMNYRCGSLVGHIWIFS